MYERNYYSIVRDVERDEEQNVKIDGYRGKWSAFEKIELDGAVYYIYEHNTYGDETCYLVVCYVDEAPIDVYETYDGLIQCLVDEEIIDVM